MYMSKFYELIFNATHFLVHEKYIGLDAMFRIEGETWKDFIRYLFNCMLCVSIETLTERRHSDYIERIYTRKNFIDRNTD